MKAGLVATAALMVVVTAPAWALNIDITNNPNRDFLLGYEHTYSGKDCDVRWWASQNGAEYIVSIGECTGISDQRMIADMNDLMATIKRLRPEFKNFADYNRWKEKAAKEVMANMIPSPGYPVQFCLDGDRGEYFFSSNGTSFKPGWHPIYLRKNQNNNDLERIGYWQMTTEGAVVATSDTASTVIHEQETRPCGYVRRR